VESMSHVNKCQRKIVNFLFAEEKKNFRILHTQKAGSRSIGMVKKGQEQVERGRRNQAGTRVTQKKYSMKNHTSAYSRSNLKGEEE